MPACTDVIRNPDKTPQVERLQRKFTTIHSTLAQQTSGTPKVDSEPSLRASQAATEPEQPPKVRAADDGRTRRSHVLSPSLGGCLKC